MKLLNLKVTKVFSIIVSLILVLAACGRGSITGFDKAKANIPAALGVPTVVLQDPALKVTVVLCDAVPPAPVHITV